jgi:ANCHR-like B-box zinc-binding protein
MGGNLRKEKRSQSSRSDRATRPIGICQYCPKQATVRCEVCKQRMCGVCGAKHEKSFGTLNSQLSPL